MTRRAGPGLGLALGLVIVAVLEGLCRLAPAPDPRVPDGKAAQGTITLEGNPWLLWQLRPGDRTEHGKPVHVNALGLRHGDIEPSTGLRILALGDSSVYGFGVGDDEVFTARIEQDLAAMHEFKPDLAIGTTPVVQAAKELTIPALYFTNLISARPLMGPAGAGSLATVINAAMANKGRFDEMKAFFGDVGEGANAGIWEDVPEHHPEFREHYKRHLSKAAKKRKAEEMV